MAVAAQLLINTIIACALYALVASGFALIYSVTKVVHLGHGGVITMGAFVMYWLSQTIAINFWFSLLITLGITSLLGFLIHAFVYAPLEAEGASASTKFIAGIALLALLEALILLLFGAGVKTFALFKTIRGVEVLGGVITHFQILLILISLLTLCCLTVLMHKTRMGHMLQAVADNKQLAETLGISSVKTWNWAFVIGSGLAGFAGILIALEQSLDPMMGSNLIIKAFTAAVIGGLNNILGAFRGAFILAVAESFGVWLFPSGYKDLVAFLLLIIFLAWKHQGIFYKGVMS